MAYCDNCMANKVCDHNRFGFENCGNYIPTSDVVEVVRCKDCKYYMRLGRFGCFCRRRIKSNIEYRIRVDDFCSYGKRKEGELKKKYTEERCDGG